ncbi:MAG: FTR1 family protein [Candidatus Thorarchaeota archaeon]
MIVTPLIVSLREGIEIALILAIMLSYLRKTNQNDLKRYVFGGVALSIVVSVATAILMAGIWGIFEGPALAMFEGSVVLVASFLLTTMILWMWKAGSGISSEIEGSMQRSTGIQSGLGLLLLSFALILREGVELVLFTTALVIQDGLVTYLGMAIGLAIALAIGIGIYQGSLKISLKALFNSTSILLVLFAAGMIAYGIHELQEAGLLLIGPIEVWNINPPLLPDGSFPLLHEKGAIGSLAKTLFGYNGNPSALEVVAYISYLFIVSGYYILSRKHNKPTPVSDHPVPVVTS